METRPDPNEPAEQLSFRLPANLKKSFRVRLSEIGKTGQDVLSDFVSAFVDARTPNAQTAPVILASISAPHPELAIHPVNAGQWRILKAVLDMISDDTVCEVHMPILKALVAPQLRKYPETHPPGSPPKARRKPKQESAA